MNQHEKTLNRQQQVSNDIVTKVKALGRFHRGCGEKVLKIKEPIVQFRLGEDMESDGLYLYAISNDYLFDDRYNKYPFDTLSIDELVSLVGYINEL
jgi:hypothetical protein